MTGQKNDCFGRREPGALRPQVPRDHSPVLTWLSLVGLLPSRAQLRFARRDQVYQGCMASKRMHPARDPVMDGVVRHHSAGVPQDATENYPQSYRATQVFRLRGGTMGGYQYQDCDRNSNRTTGQRSPRLLEVRMQSAGLRSVIAAAIRTTLTWTDLSSVEISVLFANFHIVNNPESMWSEVRVGDGGSL